VREKIPIVEEISTMEISQDGELLAVAYAGVKSILAVWSLSSKTLLATLQL